MMSSDEDSSQGPAVGSIERSHRASAGWCAELALRFDKRGDKTVLASRRQHGPLLVQRPFYPEGDGVCQVYLLHPPAGIVGGDDLRMSFELECGSHALLTTPGATRWNFSHGRIADLVQDATVANGATLEWLPQENLIFDGAHAKLSTRIDLAGSGRFLGWEMLGLGRPACRERFVDGSVDFRFELFRDGQPLVLERLRSERGGLAGVRDYAACGTFIVTSVEESVLSETRRVLEATSDTLCAATLIGDVMITRGLAEHCEPLRNTFERVWSVVRPLAVERSAISPRIWHT